MENISERVTPKQITHFEIINQKKTRTGMQLGDEELANARNANNA
jgi:hypothetical protein